MKERLLNRKIRRQGVIFPDLELKTCPGTRPFTSEWYEHTKADQKNDKIFF